VGDLLRSSAAWRSIKARYPDSELHLWFLTADRGAASEELIRRHHLLSSFHVSDKRTHGLEGWKRLIKEGYDVVDQVRPECIIDFEPHGLRTSILTWLLGRRTGADTWGIAQVPLRRFFYHTAAPSTRKYAMEHQLPVPLEYTERDYVVLASQRISRFDTQIELRETSEGRAFRESLQTTPGFEPGRNVIGINLGCGTPGALPRRPDVNLVACVANKLREKFHASILLTGAPYEAQINQQLASRLKGGHPVLDLAGQTNMLQLAGAISACRLFISGDSGPYHMAVGLRVPTVTIFNFPNREAYHHNPLTRCVVASGEAHSLGVLRAAESLLAMSPAPSTR
jgi:ADP-heptose:LPS heptosyltransferase